MLFPRVHVVKAMPRALHVEGTRIMIVSGEHYVPAPPPLPPAEVQGETLVGDIEAAGCGEPLASGRSSRSCCRLGGGGGCGCGNGGVEVGWPRRRAGRPPSGPRPAAWPAAAAGVRGCLLMEYTIDAVI